MFIRLKNNGDEKNVVISSITHFIPTSDGGTEIYLVANGSVKVTESNRTVRNAIKKASAPSIDTSED